MRILDSESSSGSSPTTSSDAGSDASLVVPAPGPARLSDAVAGAREWLTSRQNAAGFWHAELEGDTTSRHGTRNGLPHVLIELRQDLIATPDDQRLWAERLAPMLAQVIEEDPDG